MTKPPHNRPRYGQRRRLIYLAALGIAAVAAAALLFAATVNYPGQRALFLVFVFLYASMLALALPPPRLYAYTFLSTFLFLGFCAKSVAYLGLGVALVEPTGNFNGTGKAWDAALVPAVAGALAVVVIRLIHLFSVRGTRNRSAVEAIAPAWYVRRRTPVLAASIAFFIALNVFNLFAAAYQVGVTPRVVLPAHMNVLTSWLIVSGLAIWAATLVGWEAKLRSGRFGRILFVPFAEAFASVSTLSRAAYLFRALSYLLVVGEFPAFFRDKLSKPWRVGLWILLPAGLVISLGAVSLLRIAIYPGIAETPPTAVVTPATPAPTAASPTPISATPLPTSPTPSATTASPTLPAPTPARTAFTSDPRLKFVGREIGTLIVGRWIGIEGTMAVSSYRGLSLDLFAHAVSESPTVGELALYQRVSGSSYQTTSKYTFLTVPGAIAVLYLSGSVVVVFCGMAVLAALLISFELLASRLLGNAMTVSFVAITLANAVAQMDFPYLLFVFLLEQAVCVAVLGLVGPAVTRRARPISSLT